MRDFMDLKEILRPTWQKLLLTLGISMFVYLFVGYALYGYDCTGCALSMRDDGQCDIVCTPKNPSLYETWQSVFDTTYVSGPLYHPMAVFVLILLSISISYGLASACFFVAAVPSKKPRKGKPEKVK